MIKQRGFCNSIYLWNTQLPPKTLTPIHHKCQEVENVSYNRIAAQYGQRDTAVSVWDWPGPKRFSTSRVNPPKGVAVLFFHGLKHDQVWSAYQRSDSLPHSLEIKHNPGWGNLIFWGWHCLRSPSKLKLLTPS